MNFSYPCQSEILFDEQYCSYDDVCVSFQFNEKYLNAYQKTAFQVWMFMYEFVRVTACICELDCDVLTRWPFE